MKIKIERIPYPKLRNDEFPTVYGQTVKIIEKHDLQALHLEKSSGELLSFRPEIESLTVYLRKSKTLSQCGDLDNERDLQIRTLVKVVAGFGNLNLPEIQSHYEVLDDLLNKHRAKTIAAASRAAETERLLMLEAEVNSNSEIQNALNAFGLTPVAERLFAVNRQYDEVFRSYIAEKSETPRIDIVTLRNKASKALVQFLDAVQYSAYLYEDLDYTPLVAELRELNQYYIRQIKARDTRRKNGAKTDEEPPIPPLEN